MKKRISIIVLSILVLAAVIPAQAQMERYFRKSVSLFTLHTPKDMTRSQSKIVYNALLDQLQSMGRFDYNPLPLRPGLNLTQVFGVVKEYAQDKQVERASKQFELMDEHYKEERITGETLDKLIAGAYVLVPSISDYRVSKDVEKKTNKESKDYWVAKLSVDYTLKVEVWNASNIGSDAEPNWEPFMESSFSISGHGSESETFYKKVEVKNVRDEMAEQALEKSLFLLNLQLSKSLRQLEMFKIKASVTSANVKNDVVKFDFGNDVGLRVDDPFKVVYYEKKKDGSKKNVEVAYVKTRKIGKNETQAQILILKNPYKVKPSEIINPGDQIIEHPKMGLNVYFRLGQAPFSIEPDSEGVWMYYNDGVDDYYFESDQEAVSGVPSLAIGAEFDLGQYTGTPELYLFNDYTLLLNFPLLGGIGELGVRKKFYKRQLSANIGAAVGVWGINGYLGDVPFGNNSGASYMYHEKNNPFSDHIPAGSSVWLKGWAPGIGFSGGLSYLVSPEMSFNLDGGYRLYPNINENFWTVEIQDGGHTWEMDMEDIDSAPPSAKIIGAWFSAGLVYNL